MRFPALSLTVHPVSELNLSVVRSTTRNDWHSKTVEGSMDGVEDGLEVGVLPGFAVLVGIEVVGLAVGFFVPMSTHPLITRANFWLAVARLAAFTFTVIVS